MSAERALKATRPLAEHPVYFAALVEPSVAATFADALKSRSHFTIEPQQLTLDQTGLGPALRPAGKITVTSVNDGGTVNIYFENHLAKTVAIQLTTRDGSLRVVNGPAGSDPTGSLNPDGKKIAESIAAHIEGSKAMVTELTLPRRNPRLVAA